MKKCALIRKVRLTTRVYGISAKVDIGKRSKQSWKRSAIDSCLLYKHGAIYVYFTVISKLPGFLGVLMPCADSVYQALLLQREGPGDDPLDPPLLHAIIP